MECREIAMLESVSASLSEITELSTVLEIRDKAVAMATYFRAAKEGLDIQNKAALVKVRAERRAGEMLAGIELHNGDPRLHDATRLSDLGIEKTQSHRWQRLAELPLEEFNEYSLGCVSSGRELTTSALLKLAKKHAVSASTNEPRVVQEGVVGSLDELVERGDKFTTVYADPPWKYGNQATRASTDNHYPTMTLQDIADLPVRELVADKAMLFLWTTNGFLFESKALIDSWGFEFKSSIIWVKPQMGIGNYVRNSHEFLLIANRGGMRTASAGKSQMSWIRADRGKHSSKPSIFRQTVESLSEPNRLELFGRESVPGWTVFGNQVREVLC